MTAEFTLDEDLKEWQKQYWDPLECTIELTTEGNYIILDHSIQTVIGQGNRAGCTEHLAKAKHSGSF